MSTTLSPHVEVTSAPIVSRPRRSRVLRLKVLTDLDSMIAARNEWNVLAGDHPFSRWEWIVTWWKNYQQDCSARVLVVLDSDNRWVGLFPLYVYKHRFWGRVLANMGNGRTCSDHVRPIVDPDQASESVVLISNWIAAQASMGNIDLVDWDGVDQGDPLIEALEERLTQAGMACRKSGIEGTWIARLTGEWSDFERITKKCFRRKLTKARRNLVEHGLNVTILTEAADIRLQWKSFTELHEARQKQKEIVGCFGEIEFSKFLEDAIAELAVAGDAALLIAQQEGRPFGAILLLFAGNRAYLYQSGFDPAKRALEPGHLLVMSAIQYAIERGKTHFDFLRGDEPYKSRWNTTCQPMNRVRIFSPRWLSWFRMRIWDWRQRSRSRRTLGRVAGGLDDSEND